MDSSTPSFLNEDELGLSQNVDDFLDGGNEVKIIFSADKFYPHLERSKYLPFSFMKKITLIVSVQYFLLTLVCKC